MTTILVVVTVADMSGQDIYLPASETNSVLTVDHDAPDVVVGSLEEEADSVRGSADGAGADKVEVSMDIVPTGEAEKPIPVRAIREKAKEAHPRAELGLILEIDVAKTITTGGTDNREDINTTDNVLELVIPYDLTGKSGVWVHRYHNAGGDNEGATTFQALNARPARGDRNDGTFYLDRVNNLIHVYARKFSTYAVSYVTETTPPPPSTGGGGGGSSGGGRTWLITASAGEGGTIQPQGKVYVSSGADKAFSIRPEAGYTLQDVLVDGKSVGPSGTYTFENVRANHSIKAVFSAIPTGVEDLLNTDDHYAYLHGFKDGLFRPDANMTRGQAAQMFYNLLRDRSIPAADAYADVPEEMWCREAVEALRTLGIMVGVHENRFEPNRPITRGEFVVTAMRFVGQPKPDTDVVFSDVSEKNWFYPQVMAAAGFGWIGGYGDGTFRPYEPISRAEAAKVVNRMLRRSADKTYVDSHSQEICRFPDVAAAYWAYYDIMESANSHDHRMEDQRETWVRLRTA